MSVNSTLAVHKKKKDCVTYISSLRCNCVCPGMVNTPGAATKGGKMTAVEKVIIKKGGSRYCSERQRLPKVLQMKGSENQIPES